MADRPGIVTYGENALLVEVSTAEEALGLLLRVEPEARRLGLLDLVPGARTLALVAAPGTSLDTLRSAVRALLDDLDPLSRIGSGSTEAVVEVPVTYDGADLEVVAHLSGLSPREVVERHTGHEYAVAFCGFAPGFAYLSGLPQRLHVPRAAEPRTRVPAGAVAVAGGWTAVYPRASPGGWRLIGRTTLVLWDLDTDPPSPLAPGTRVRFVEVDG